MCNVTNRDAWVNSCAQVMGKELGDQFGLLCKELWTLNDEISTFVELFSQNTEIDLLNESAPEFFSLVQRLLYDNIALRIARFSDPAASSGGQHPNLSLTNLVQTLASNTPILGADIERINNVLTEVKKAAEPFKLWRNKVIAHSDLYHATKGFPEFVTSEQAEEATVQIDLLLSLVGKLYNMFGMTQPGTTDVRGLLKYLRAAKPELERQRKVEDEIIEF